MATIAQASSRLVANSKVASAIQFSLTMIIRSPALIPSEERTVAISSNALIQIAVAPGCPVLDQRDPVGGFGNLPCRDVMDAARQADSNLVEIDRL